MTIIATQEKPWPIIMTNVAVKVLKSRTYMAFSSIRWTPSSKYCRKYSINRKRRKRWSSNSSIAFSSGESSIESRVSASSVIIERFNSINNAIHRAVIMDWKGTKVKKVGSAWTISNKPYSANVPSVLLSRHWIKSTGCFADRIVARRWEIDLV